MSPNPPTRGPRRPGTVRRGAGTAPERAAETHPSHARRCRPLQGPGPVSQTHSVRYGVGSEAARVAERDSLPLHRDARQASIDVGLDGVQLGGMGLSQGPGLARRVLLEERIRSPTDCAGAEAGATNPTASATAATVGARRLSLEEPGDPSLSS